jgi:catalase
MVAGLRNVDDDLARAVADGLGLAELPDPVPAAATPIDDLAPSPALSIIENGPSTFAGRKVGALVADGVDAATLDALRTAVTDEGALLELVAPTVHGIHDSAGNELVIDQKIDGGPSVLYDAVAVLLTDDAVAVLSNDAASKTFVSDAHAHCKFIAHDTAAEPLFLAAGVRAADRDEGYHPLDGSSGAASAFVEACRDLRLWSREAKVNQT